MGIPITDVLFLDDARHVPASDPRRNISENPLALREIAAGAGPWAPSPMAVQAIWQRAKRENIPYGRLQRNLFAAGIGLALTNRFTPRFIRFDRENVVDAGGRRVQIVPDDLRPGCFRRWLVQEGKKAAEALVLGDPYPPTPHDMLGGFVEIIDLDERRRQIMEGQASQPAPKRRVRPIVAFQQRKVGDEYRPTDDARGIVDLDPHDAERVLSRDDDYDDSDWDDEQADPLDEFATNFRNEIVAILDRFEMDLISTAFTNRTLASVAHSWNINRAAVRQAWKRLQERPDFEVKEGMYILQLRREQKRQREEESVRYWASL